VIATKAAGGYGAAYCGLVAATVLLPSAKIQDVNVKFVLAAALLACGVFVWRELLSRHLAVLAYMGVVIACWSLVALGNAFDPLPEIRSMLGPLFLVATYHPHLVPKPWLLGAYCGAAVAYAALKLLLVLGIYLGAFTEFGLVEIGRSLFDIEMVAGPTCTAGLRRIALPNDLAVAMFPLLLVDARYRRPWMYAAVTLCGLAVLASYSRYLALAFIAVSVVAAWQLAPTRARVALAIAVLVPLAIAHAIDRGACLLPRFIGAANAAVSEADKVVSYSDGRALNLHADSVRKEQLARLKQLIAQKPLLGHGVGSYDRDYVRSPRMPYAYELQLVSFVAKFGVIGFALLALGALALCALLFGSNVAAWAVVLTLAASGVANPYYESSAFGVAFVLTGVILGRWSRS